MGSITFTNARPIEGSNHNEFSFDSSPERAVCQALGLDPRTFRLEARGEDDQFLYFDVQGAQNRSDDSGPQETRLRGFLTQEKASWRLANRR